MSGPGSGVRATLASIAADTTRPLPGCGATPPVSVLDMHTGGEPLRVVLAGWPDEAALGPGAAATRRALLAGARHDAARRLLMNEPRGHRDMYGAVLAEPAEPGAHLAAAFVHNEGCSTMCGHAVLALGRFAVDFGLAPPPAPSAPSVDGAEPETEVRIEVPCGLVTAFVRRGADGASDPHVRFHSVPAFAFCLDELVAVPGYGQLAVDVAYGGTFYAFLSASSLGLDVRSSSTKALVEGATAVTEAVKKQVRLFHPDGEELAFLYGTILTDGSDGFSEEPTANVCVFADAQVDRSPTGSGVTARVALQHRRGLLSLGQTRRFESGTTGSVFSGKAIAELRCGRFPAVIVEVGGEAHYVGTARFSLEEGDRLGAGFLLR
ncbi:trans-3-hydroxy-L-proline dehydratase [Lampetra fluviatilis]